MARETSEAMVNDGSLHSDQDKGTRLLDTTYLNKHPSTTQLYTQYPENTQMNTSIANIRIADQGTLSIEEYIKYGDACVVSSVNQYEMQAVKTFIGGLRNKNAQQELTVTLDKIGWKWEKAKDEMHRMVEAGKKRKRNRRTMPDVI